jgi:DNA-binding response OmpR family regulator
VRMFLTAEGYRVIEAGDGLEAIEVFRKNRLVIDAVLIDLIMPRLGGRETYLRLREMSPRIKALFATGYGSDEQIQELLGTGVLGIIKKPYEMSSLERELRSILDRSEA